MNKTNFKDSHRSYYTGTFELSLDIPSILFNANTKDAKKYQIINHIDNAFRSKYFVEQGYILKILDLIEIKQCYQSTITLGYTFTRIIVYYLGYKIILNEPILGKILKIDKEKAKPVLLISTGPITVSISSSLLPDISYEYNVVKNIFFSATSKKTLEEGNLIRFVIIEKSEKIHKRTGEIFPFLTGSLRGFFLNKV